MITEQRNRKIKQRNREDINHVLFRCGKYDEEREFMFRKIEQEKKKVILGVNEIIRNRD